MRKVRDFDAELVALEQRARQLKQRKVQQYGELIEATGADALDPNLLAGALLAAVAETDKAATGAWTSRGAQFFRDTARKRPRSAARTATGKPALAAGPQPAGGSSGEA